MTLHKRSAKERLSSCTYYKAIVTCDTPKGSTKRV